MIELEDHPYFVTTQAHPEFLSRFLHPHPLFTGFLKAILKPPRITKKKKEKVDKPKKEKVIKKKSQSKKRK